MNKTETKEILSVLDSLQKAKSFLLREEVLICTKTNGEPYLNDYINNEGKGISPICKFMGSDLVYLDHAISGIKSLFNYYVLTYKLGDIETKKEFKTSNAARNYLKVNSYDVFNISLKNRLDS